MTSFHGVDGYTDTFPLDKAMDPTTRCRLRDERPPAPTSPRLPGADHRSRPLRREKREWIDRIRLSATEEQGFYETRVGPDFVVRTQSRFTTPDFARPFAHGGALLRGTAFAGDRGVAKVEVSVDDGASWQPARIDYSAPRLTWSLWSYQWNPSRPGEHRLAVRAYDRTGATQVEENKSSGPEGATGLHRVTAQVA